MWGEIQRTVASCPALLKILPGLAGDPGDSAAIRRTAGYVLKDGHRRSAIWESSKGIGKGMGMEKALRGRLAPNLAPQRKAPGVAAPEVIGRDRILAVRRGFGRRRPPGQWPAPHVGRQDAHPSSAFSLLNAVGAVVARELNRGAGVGGRMIAGDLC